MAKTATVFKPAKAWAWATPKGKLYWETFQTKYDAQASAEYNYGGEGFKVVRVWLQPVTK